MTFIWFALLNISNATVSKILPTVVCDAALWAGAKQPASNLVHAVNQALPVFDSIEAVDESWSLGKLRDFTKEFLLGQDASYNVIDPRARVRNMAGQVAESPIDDHSAGWVIRGSKDISSTLDRLERRIYRLNPVVLGQLKQRFPPIRSPYIAAQGIGALAAFVPLVNQSPVWTAVSFGAVFLKNRASSAFRRNAYFAPWIEPHLKELRAGLEKGYVSPRVFSAFILGNVDIHRALLRLNNDQPFGSVISHITDASEPAFANLFDGDVHSRDRKRLGSLPASMVDNWAERIKRAPGEYRRNLQFYSVYFQDPKSGDPVWIFFYQGRRGSPRIGNSAHEASLEKSAYEALPWAPAR